MLAAARWLLSQTKASLIQALDEQPGYQLRIVGECQALDHPMSPGSQHLISWLSRHSSCQ
jgi:hypothetical protein